jgi:hypothetical protein
MYRTVDTSSYSYVHHHIRKTTGAELRMYVFLMRGQRKQRRHWHRPIDYPQRKILQRRIRPLTRYGHSEKKYTCIFCFTSAYITPFFALTPLANIHHFFNCVLSLWLPTFYYAKPLIFDGNIVFYLRLFRLRSLFKERNQGVKQGLGVYGFPFRQSQYAILMNELSWLLSHCCTHDLRHSDQYKHHPLRRLKAKHLVQERNEIGV